MNQNHEGRTGNRLRELLAKWIGYPINLMIRIAERVFALFARIFIFLLTIVILIIFLKFVPSKASETKIIGTNFLVTVGLTSSYFGTKFFEAAVKQLKTMINMICDQLNFESWLLSYDFRKSFRKSLDGLIASKNSMYPVPWRLLICSIFFTLSIGTIDTTVQKVRKYYSQFQFVENQYYFPDFKPPLPKPKRIVFKSHTIFPVVFVSNADLDTKRGICLDTDSDSEDHSMSIWLEKFKDSISKCSDKNKQLQLEIWGFSSIAPVSINGDYSSSDLLNCEIANQRSEAVLSFILADLSPDHSYFKDKSCAEVVGGTHWSSDSSELCKRKRKEFSYTVEYAENANLNLVYKPWYSYEDMRKNIPVNDGTFESRIPNLEVLNRSVFIVVKNNSCWQPESLDHYISID